MGDNPPHILFLIRSLERGGAERQLVMLASGLRRQGWLVAVACFYAGGPFRRDLEDADVQVINLAKHGRWDVFGFLWRLIRTLQKTRPDIVHGYLPVPNILSLLARLNRPKCLVVWGVRASNMDFSRFDRLSRFTFWLQCRLARYADLSIVNSSAGLEYHVIRGFPRGAMRVIQNGIDTSHFHFDPRGRERMRHAWGVPQSAMLVGLVGRVDPMKDHPTFLKAAARLISTDSSWWFVCIGGCASEDMARLSEQATELGLAQRLTWTGACDDMSAAYSALDMAASSSYGEGFPNVVAEAMACGRPCVVTDVGDSARIVGGFGVVVPPRDAAALSDGICRLRERLERNPTELTRQVRDHVIKCFGPQALIDATVEYLRNGTAYFEHVPNTIRPSDDV
jgi:glycosyltransferase involved in cell wall biosynthesis